MSSGRRASVPPKGCPCRGRAGRKAAPRWRLSSRKSVSAPTSPQEKGPVRPRPASRNPPACSPGLARGGGMPPAEPHARGCGAVTFPGSCRPGTAVCLQLNRSHPEWEAAGCLYLSALSTEQRGLVQRAAGGPGCPYTARRPAAPGPGLPAAAEFGHGVSGCFSCPPQ